MTVRGKFRRAQLGFLLTSYFITSLTTVLILVSAWMSTPEDAAVRRLHDKPTDPPCLSIAPRTQIPPADQKELPQALTPSTCSYPAEEQFFLLVFTPVPPCNDVHFFADLSNKAPPEA
jgi:hypothetical protein